MNALSPDMNSIFNNVIAAVIVGLTVFFLKMLKPAMLSFDTRWTIWFVKRELAKLEVLTQNPMAVTHFFLTQMMWIMAIASVGVTLCAMAFIDGGTRWLAYIIPIAGLTIYGVAIYTIGMGWRCRNADTYLDRLSARLGTLTAKHAATKQAEATTQM